jgi:flagellar basal-body rod protein FlgG
MSGRAEAIDVLSNNLANVNTNGYKADKLAASSFNKMLLSRIDDAPPGVFAKINQPPQVGQAEMAGGVTDNRYIDFAPGGITFTENPLDLALDGPGFFTLDGGNGQVFYCREGAFTIDSDRYLINQSGLRVLDEAGQPISIYSPGEIKVDSDGSISIGGLPAGKLWIVEFTDVNTLTKAGHNLFSSAAAGGYAPAGSTEVIQGAIERSNVNAVYSLTQLLAKFREFEAAARTIDTIDRTLDKVVNEVGRISG